MSEHDVAMAVLFANEAETWLLSIKNYMPSRELKIAVDDGVRANKRVRNLITGRFNLDTLTDCSAILSDIAIKVKTDPAKSGELMALLKAWTDGEVQSEEDLTARIEVLNKELENLRDEVRMWQGRYDAVRTSYLSVTAICEEYSDKAIVQMGIDALERIYQQVELAMRSNPTFRDTGDPVIVGDSWGEYHFGVLGHKLTKQLKQRKMSKELLYKMHDFFYNENEIELQAERSAVA